MLCSSHQIFLDDQIKTNKMGRACSMYGGGEVHRGFWWGTLREGGRLEDPGIDGRIILKWIFEKWDGGVDDINLA